MRIVLDTNVLVSAFATRGICTDLFEVCILEHQIITSEYILSELEEALEKKVRLPSIIVIEIINYVREVSEVVEPHKTKISVCRDPDDIMILCTAAAGNTEYLITGDNDLLSIKRYENFEIIPPREFWNRLRKQ